MLYLSIKNLTRGSILAPNLDIENADIDAIVKV